MNCNWHYIESCISETTLIETGKESCPAFITIVMINTTTKSNLKRKRSIGLVYSNDSPSLRELREGTEAGGSCLWTCSVWHAHMHYYSTQSHLPGDGNTDSGLCSTTSIINQKNAPQMCLQTIWWRHTLIKVPLPRWL